MKYCITLITTIFLFACQSQTKKNADVAGKSEPPKILKPQIKKIWIPPELQDGGRVFVDGHWRYEVERSTSFGR